MESRLPKPKIVLKKSRSSIDVNVVVNKQDNINKMSQVTRSGLSQEKKTKSTNNINSKPTNENKEPRSQNLLRAKTMGTITRSNGVNNKAVKRPGTTIANEIERKKPTAKSTVKPADTLNARKKPLATNNATNKPQSTAGSKFKPWDLRGRLAHTSDELTNIRGKYKDVTSKNSELEDLINSLKTSEGTCRQKAEKLEVVNAQLSDELDTLKTEVNKMRSREGDLKSRIEELDASLKNVSSMLQECRTKCIQKDTLLSEQGEELRTMKKDLEQERQINEELTTIKGELETLVHTMDKDRRVLHNAIQELKGNIRVFCRVRPRTPREASKVLCNINYLDECTVEVGKFDGSDAMSCSGKIRPVRQEFSFDKVFPPNATQADIFEELSLLVQSALEGYNVCVFAYGQTGSGKTYTMEGEPGDDTEGMIPRTIRHIFKEMKQFQLLGWEYRIEASFLEIYNEHIVDLLDSQPKQLEIRMVDAKGTDLYVSNLRIEEIDCPEKLQECLTRAQCNRAVAATQSNERSSRSHSVTRIRLIGTHKTKEEISIGNLNLVDLAGSERLKAEEAARNKETKNINKSLSNLGNVILALLKKQEHVPYRNSKLTHLLMPSLGGNSKTLMLLNVSPLDECYNETLNSLRFASNVNSCKTGNVKRTRTVLQNSM